MERQPSYDPLYAHPQEDTTGPEWTQQESIAKVAFDLFVISFQYFIVDELRDRFSPTHDARECEGWE